MKLLYKITFWTGYAAMLILAVLPSGGNLSGKNVATIRLDYLVHFGVYLAIAMYIIAGRKFGFQLFRNHSTTKSIIIVILLAVITELLQLAVPYRTFNPLDLVANVAGVAVCLLVCWSSGLLVRKKSDE